MIRIISPRSPEDRCIERQARRLDRRLGDVSRVYVVMPNAKSKNECHQLIRQWKNEDLIVFMGHGRSDGLVGSRALFAGMMGAEDSLDRAPELYYDDEYFIGSDDYSLLADKKVACFACESDLLGEELIKAGAIAIVGFGKMPSSKEEFDPERYDKRMITRAMIAALNGAINVAFRDAVIMAVRMNGEMSDLAIYFKMEIRRQVSMLLHSKAKYRAILASILYNIARTVKVLGDQNAKI